MTTNEDSPSERVAWRKIVLRDGYETAAMVCERIVELAGRRDVAADRPKGFCIFTRLEIIESGPFTGLTLYFSPEADHLCYDLMASHRPVYCLSPRDTPDLNQVYPRTGDGPCRKLLERKR